MQATSLGTSPVCGKIPHGYQSPLRIYFVAPNHRALWGCCETLVLEKILFPQIVTHRVCQFCQFLQFRQFRIPRLTPNRTLLPSFPSYRDRTVGNTVLHGHPMVVRGVVLRIRKLMEHEFSLGNSDPVRRCPVSPCSTVPCEWDLSGSAKTWDWGSLSIACTQQRP